MHVLLLKRLNRCVFIRQQDPCCSMCECHVCNSCHSCTHSLLQARVYQPITDGVFGVLHTGCVNNGHNYCMTTKTPSVVGWSCVDSDLNQACSGMANSHMHNDNTQACVQLVNMCTEQSYTHACEAQLDILRQEIPT